MCYTRVIYFWCMLLLWICGRPIVTIYPSNVIVPTFLPNTVFINVEQYRAVWAFIVSRGGGEVQDKLRSYIYLV